MYLFWLSAGASLPDISAHDALKYKLSQSKYQPQRAEARRAFTDSAYATSNPLCVSLVELEKADRDGETHEPDVIVSHFKLEDVVAARMAETP